MALNKNSETSSKPSREAAKGSLGDALDHSREVFWLLTGDLKQVVYVSPSYEAIWGFSVDALYRDPSNWLQAIIPEDRARVEKAFFDGVRRGEFNEQYRIVNAQGETRWIRERVFPVITADGELTQIFGIAEDITEQKDSENQRAHLLRGTLQDVEDLTILREITESVTSTLALQSVLATLLEKIAVLLPYSASTIRLLNRETGLLERVASRNIDHDKWSALPPNLLPLSEAVLKGDQAAIVVDAAYDPRIVDDSFIKSQAFRSGMLVPLRAKGEAIGILTLLTRSQHRFDPGEIELATMIAAQAGMALYNSQLYEDLARKTREFSALYTITTTASESLDLDTVLRDVLPKLCEIFRFNATRVFLLDADGNQLSLKASYETSVQFAPQVKSLRLGQGLLGRAAASGEAVIYEDIRTDMRYQKETLHRGSEKAGHRFCAALPIKSKQRILGYVLCIGDQPRRLTLGEEQLLRSITNQIGIAVDNTSLFEETKTRAVELQEANRVKSDFMNAMSHELRTPLNVSIGYLGLLLDGFGGVLNETQREALEVVDHQARSLDKLITNVLSSARTEAGKLRLEVSTAPLDDTLAHIRAYVKQLNRDKRLKIRWDVDPDIPPLTVDHLKVEEILQNLIGNAYKFTPAGRMSIRIRNRPYDEIVEFTVADTGIGMKQEELERIFEEFYQIGAAHTGARTGLGLGLSIVKRYVDLMGGHLRVTSTPGTGSQFTFTLPYSLG
jgi:PAS domain S-box-containing protein